MACLVMEPNIVLASRTPSKFSAAQRRRHIHAVHPLFPVVTCIIYHPTNIVCKVGLYKRFVVIKQMLYVCRKAT